MVLRGLGIGWAKLPPGFVHDDVNLGVSASELAFLRYGQMGALRPLFVTGKKRSGPFGDDSGAEVEFINTPDGGFQLRVKELMDPADFPDPGRPGSAELRFPMQPVDSRDVSRAISKMALLMLWVHAAPPNCHDLGLESGQGVGRFRSGRVLSALHPAACESVQTRCWTTVSGRDGDGVVRPRPARRGSGRPADPPCSVRRPPRCDVELQPVVGMDPTVLGRLEPANVEGWMTFGMKWT